MNRPRRGCSPRRARAGALVQPVAGHRERGEGKAREVWTGTGETRITMWASSTRGCCSTLCFNFIQASRVRSRIESINKTNTKERIDGNGNLIGRFQVWLGPDRMAINDNSPSRRWPTDYLISCHRCQRRRLSGSRRTRTRACRYSALSIIIRVKAEATKRGAASQTTNTNTPRNTGPSITGCKTRTLPLCTPK